MKKNSFSILQLELFATSSSTISITPLYQEKQYTYLMGKTISPFKASHDITVPFWFAILLKQRDKCKIHIPPYLQIVQLTRILEQEKSSQDLKFLHEQYFFELSYILLNKAADTFEKPRQVRSLIQSLQTVRFQKYKRILQKTQGGRRFKYLTNYQINKWRSGMSNLQKMVLKLKKEQK